MRVGILADKYRDRDSLFSMLKASDIEVAGIQTTRTFLSCHSEPTPDAYLVEVTESTSSSYLRELVSRAHVPLLILLYSGTNTESLDSRLAEKLKGIVDAHDRRAESASHSVPRSCNAKECNRLSTISSPVIDAAARDLWVLGASIGGPLALARFLSGLPADLPISFILVQQIDELFLELFIKQLEESTKLPVRMAADGQFPACGTVHVVGNEGRFRLGQDGRMSITPESWSSRSGPCLDDVIEEVVEYSGERSGTIIFSATGDDGVRGSHTVFSKGGNVWVQSIESSVIGGMHGNVARTGVARFSGTPEMLADRLVELYRKDR